MSKKGRRGRANKRPSTTQASPAAEQQVVVAEPEVIPPPEPEVVPEAIEAAAPEEPPVAETPEAGDDSSYPPVDLDNYFFDGTPRTHEPAVEHEERDPRLVLKLTPEVARRRADLQKYVKFAVAGASMLCLAALVKVAVARSHPDEGTRRPVAVAAAAPEPVQAPVQAVAPPPQAAPPPAETQVVPVPPAPPPAETVAAAVPAPTETAPAPAAAAPAPTETVAAAAEGAPPQELDPKAAAKEKNVCRAALERGKTADAIEAGERSVALDPTDGEAWLILGASYQAKGDMKNARRSYKACLEQGKRGPKGECAAMPH